MGLDLWKMELVRLGQTGIKAGEAEGINGPGLDEDESSGTTSSAVCIARHGLPTLTVVRGHQSLL